MAGAVVGGKLFVAGGAALIDGKHGKPMRTVDVYDPATDQWTSLPPMLTPRMSFALVPVGKTLYAIGGSDGKTPLPTVEALKLP